MPPRKKQVKNDCSVMGCNVTSVNSPGTRFYSFPSVANNSIRRRLWIEAIRNHNPQQAQWNPNRVSRICSHHFIGNKKHEDPTSPSYNPTIFPEVSCKSIQSAGIGRCKRKDSPNKEDHSPKRAKIQFDDENLLENKVQLPSNATATKHRSIQVNFKDQIHYHNLNSFSCKLYITDTTCEAEVQTSLQRAPQFGNTNLCYVDKSTITNFRSHNKSCQTDTPKFDRNDMSKRLITYDVSSITSDQEMFNIAGTTLSVFHILRKMLDRQNFDTKNSIIPIDKSLLIFLMRMKTGLSFSAISSIVGVDRMTASRTFYVTLMHLAAACKKFICWPLREDVQETMPEAFNQSYKHCRVIIDCFEMPVDEPKSDELSYKFYSNCMDKFTIKALVGYTPNGVVSFVSRCFPGATTESAIVNRCGILQLLNPGDTVIADKVFSQMKQSVEDNEQQVNVVKLSFTKNPSYAKNKMGNIDKIRRVAIDVRKILRRIRAYKILNKLKVHMYPDSDSILLMCVVLVNFQIIRQL